MVLQRNATCSVSTRNSGASTPRVSSVHGARHASWFKFFLHESGSFVPLLFYSLVACHVSVGVLHIDLTGSLFAAICRECSWYVLDEIRSSWARST